MSVPVFNFLGLAPDPERNALGFQVALIQAPLENTNDFLPGTAQAPQAILTASQQLESYDLETGFDLASLGYWVSESAPLERKKSEEALGLIEAQVQHALERGCWPITLGGEKTVTLAPLRALHKQITDFSVISFDAHANLRKSYEGSEWSHASAMRRVFEMNIHQIGLGLRSLSKEEETFAEAEKINFLPDAQIEAADFDELLASLPDQVYLSISANAFSSAECPGSTHPQPGGLSWARSVQLLEAIFTAREVIGVDICDLRPLPESAQSELFIAKLITKMIAFKFAE